MSEKKLNVLMIGAFPPPIGGISVSFKILVGELRAQNKIDIGVVDFNSIRKKKCSALSKIVCLCRKIFIGAKNADVLTVYFATTALSSFGLFLIIISRILNKPLVIRKAAGFDYFDLGHFTGHIAHFVVKHTDLYLAETKNLVNLAITRGIVHVRWYPTSRPKCVQNNSVFINNKVCRRFVFVGQVREYKGIHEIVEAAERFDEKIHVDIYGPLFDDLKKNVFADCKRVKYCGILNPESVIETLRLYDMLLLPTKALTEGYPGVVFEGYSAGIPIITTHCGGIPEIVDNESGLFVKPGDSNDLFNAMKTVVEEPEVYRKLLNGVYKKSEEYDVNLWANRFVEYCHEAVSNHKLKTKH